MKYKFISILMITSTMHKKKPSYKVINNKSGIMIGYIFYYYAWNKYVLEPRILSIWDNSCLEIITGFIKELKNKEK